MLKSVKYLISLTLVGFAGLLQLSQVPYLFGVKPNFTLALIVALSRVEKSWIKRFLLILVGGFFLKFYPGLDLDNVIFILATIFIIFLIDYLPWQKPLNIALAVALATFIINLGGFSYYSFLMELGFNLALTFIGIRLVKSFYGEE